MHLFDSFLRWQGIKHNPHGIYEGAWVLPELLVLGLFESQEGVDVHVVFDSVVSLDQNAKNSFKLNSPLFNEGGLQIVDVSFFW